ncbi:ras association domain-containing protein 10 isoform X2 [Lepeophtheirus salmonis]|uniref:AGAP011031PAlike [Tribolium castaneum] n=2 Tax=Lepeophtheirus salmonis TaxID=72036 RepID=A0A0K2UXG8_LEPSM|nr:ras association domain-containing protein 10-like [Lepeophtheirus salmonis]
MSEIPFWVNDRQKWVSGITKSTTCADIISSLLDAENKSIPLEQLAIVEHWKGVQRPLSNDCKIQKLWTAWGDEKTRVKFVLKRIGRKRRRRRRYESKDDVIYPRSSDIEKLMRIIVNQGETIRSQLVKLHEREKQIDVIEETVHDARTKLAGKDYLLRALNEHDDGSGGEGTQTPELIHELELLLTLNERLEKTEERIGELTSRLEEESGECNEQIRQSREDCLKLRILNDASSEEISQNQRCISGVRDLVNERNELASRLEEELDRADFEEKELRAKLDRISNMDLQKVPKTDIRNISPHSSTSGYYEEEDEEEEEMDEREPFVIPDPSKKLSFTKFTKSILKAVGVSLPPGGTISKSLNIQSNKEDFVLDDNSDTGLSSLHSSTDEGTYTLDTLV